VFVWGYALAWFLVSDRVKLLAYRIFDPVNVSSPAGKQPDLTLQIAQRAYELYENRGRRDGGAAGDWLQAESEIRRDGATNKGKRAMES
jgi:H+-transporting ATPase